MNTTPGDCAAWLLDATGNPIPLRGSCTLGRSASNQVALTDDRVSRRHAMIQVQQAGEFWLVDFGSRNGTYLSGQRLARPTRLQHGDRIRVGPFELVFQQPDSAGTQHASSASADQTVTDIRAAKCWLLVADIIDSTRLVTELPPDELPLVTGQWLAECKQTIEGNGGRINQFLGDGLFAFWHDRERMEVSVDQALQALRRLQDQGRPPFRLALHLGPVMFGGASVGEGERISGSEMHFIFRMESLSKTLGEPRLLSEAAWGRLAALVEAQEVGRHSLKGFEGQYLFYSF